MTEWTTIDNSTTISEKHATEIKSTMTRWTTIDDRATLSEKHATDIKSTMTKWTMVDKGATLSPTSPIINRTVINDRDTLEMSFSVALTEEFHYVLPRAAFFDKRPRGKYKNATVVLAHLTRTAKVVACKVNELLAKAVEVRQLRLNAWLHKKFNDCTHDNVLVLCYDTSGLNKSKVSVVYENPKNESQFVSVESEHPLLVPKERKSPGSTDTVMVCTTVFDTPPHFGAWIHYQKTLGVDMVHINAQESFLSSRAYNDSFFLESLRNGFIQLQVWKEHLPPGALFYHSQALFYQDCLYRYLGVYDYCMCADTDDFLVSRDKNDPGIHRLIQNISNKKQPLNSAVLQWIRYLEPTNGFNPPEEEIKDGNLVRYLNTKTGKNEGQFLTKSIYRLSAMVELAIHESAMFLSKTKNSWKLFRGVPQTIAYVAHVRKHPREMDKIFTSCSDV